jgi:hypothetical protein
MAARGVLAASQAVHMSIERVLRGENLSLHYSRLWFPRPASGYKRWHLSVHVEKSRGCNKTGATYRSEVALQRGNGLAPVEWPGRRRMSFKICPAMFLHHDASRAGYYQVKVISVSTVRKPKKTSLSPRMLLFWRLENLGLNVFHDMAM